MAGAHRQVRAPAAGALRAARRRGAAPAHRRDEQRGVPAHAAAAARATSRAADRTPAPTGATSSALLAELDDDEVTAAFRDLGGHDLVAPARRVRPGRRRARPPDRDLRVHDQGLAAADRGPPGEPFGPPHRRATGRAWRRSSAPTPSTRGRRSIRTSREEALCRDVARTLEREPVALVASPPPPAELGREHTGRTSTQQTFGRFFTDLAHAAPEVARRVVTVSPDVASSTNLGGWINRVGHLAPRRADRLVRRRLTDARPLARERARSAHRARDRRGQPRRAAQRARSHVVTRRPGAAADRHPLRPVRQPRARTVVVRHLCRRPVDPRRHTVRCDARARGRRAPVDRDAVGRARAAAVHRLGARVRAGPRVDAAARAEPARASGRLLVLFPSHDAADRPGARRASRRPGGAASGAAASRSRAGTCFDAASRAPDVTLVATGAVVPEALAAAEVLGGGRRRRRRLPDLGRSRLPRPQGPARAGGRGGLDPRRALPAPSGLRRLSRCSTAIRTRWRSSASVRGVPVASLGVDDFGQSGDVDDLYEHFGIDAETIVGAALDLI